MGLGFGGFIDGIVLHEILQWHHMISGAEPASTVARGDHDVSFDPALNAAPGVGLGLEWLTALRARAYLRSREGPSSVAVVSTDPDCSSPKLMLPSLRGFRP